MPRTHLRASRVRPALLLSLVATATAAQSGLVVAQAAPSTVRAGAAVAKAPSTANNQTVVVQEAWVRATPGVDMAVAYLTLRNAGATTVTVTGVQSPMAGHAMIHETKVEGGQSKMRPHEQLVVAPGATIKLEPGGLHVMLHDLKQPLTVGQKVPLVILLAGGGTVQVSAAVRPLGAE